MMTIYFDAINTNETLSREFYPLRTARAYGMVTRLFSRKVYVFRVEGIHNNEMRGSRVYYRNLIEFMRDFRQMRNIERERW